MQISEWEMLHYLKNETGDEIAFSGNDTKVPLTVKSMQPTIENGGKNPKSLVFE